MAMIIKEKKSECINEVSDSLINFYVQKDTFMPQEPIMMMKLMSRVNV